MIWCYLSDISERLPGSVWSSYAQVFGSVWIASAFKGATGARQHFTNVSYHLANHQAWLETLRNVQSRHPSLRLKGWAMTGWSRYDHFAVLCDLLPTGLPSLVACLRAVGAAKGSLSELLLCNSSNLDLSHDEDVAHGGCRFPSAQAYSALVKFHSFVTNFSKNVAQSEIVGGWLNDYNTRFNFTSPRIAHQFDALLQRYNFTLKRLEKSLNRSLATIYSLDIISEWTYVYLQPLKQSLRQYSSKLSMAMTQNYWNNRPSFN